MIPTARKTLNLAFAELKKADGDPEGICQAAEKGWRAAREAIHAVLDCFGQKPEGYTLGIEALGHFEYKILGRQMRVGKQPLTDGYSRVLGTLHGRCFYEGRCPPDVKRELQYVDYLIGIAEADVKRCKESKPRRRKRNGRLA